MNSQTKSSPQSTMKSKKRGSCFFSAMSSFFTNNFTDTNTKKPKLAKPKSTPPKKTAKSATIREYVSKREPIRKKKNTIVEVLDLTDETPTINLRIKGETNEDIPIMIKVDENPFASPNQCPEKPSPSVKQPLKCDSFLSRASPGNEKDTARTSVVVFLDDEDTKTETAYLDKCVDPFSNDAATVRTHSQSVNDSVNHLSPETGIIERCEDVDLKDKIPSVKVSENTIIISDDDDLDTKLHEVKDISFESSISSNTHSNTKQPEVSKQISKKRADAIVPQVGSTFECISCDVSFTCKRTYARHLLEHKKSDKARFKCSICAKGFYMKGFLVRHLKEHLSSSQYGHCIQTQMENDDALELELKKVEELDLGKKSNDLSHQPVAESQDGVDFNQFTLVKLIHDVNGGVTNLACGYCDQCFPSQTSLVAHCRTHMDGRPFMCNICGTLFKQNAALVYHTRIHFDMIRSRQKKHSNVPFIKYVLKLHTCRDCNRSYVSWPALNQHRETVHGEVTDNLQKLDEENPDHEKTTIDPDNPDTHPSPNISSSTADHSASTSSCPAKKYFCYKCRETYPTQLLFKKHPCCHRNCPKCGEPFKSKFHNDNNTYKCCLCENPSESISDLKKHLATHRDFPTSNVCDKCGKTFKRNRGLIRHQKLHTEVGWTRKFQCATCEKTFRWRGNLLRHIRTHCIDELRCKNCNQMFILGVDLARHELQCNKLAKAILRERAVKLYNCEVCDQVFAEKLEFRKHYLSHFGISTSLQV